MEVITSYAEINKHLKIEKFSSYSRLNDGILTVISVNVESFRSKWKMIVYPMYPNNPHDTNPVHCDVTAELVCICSTAPLPTVKNIEISTAIKGREHYPKLLGLVKNEDCPTWKGVLLSRVTLQSFNLIQSDLFEFNIHFKVPEDTLYRSEDGQLAIAKDFEAVLRDPQYFDTCLISSTGSKFYAHSSILHARSNILKTAKVLSLSHAHELEHEQTLQNTNSDALLSSQESAVEMSKYGKMMNHNDVFECPNMSNSSSGISSMSDCSREPPCKNQTPLFTFSGSISSTNKSPNKKKSRLSISSPIKGNINKSMLSPVAASPKKSEKSNSTLTPSKKSIEKIDLISPSKMTQTQLTHFFSCSSSLNTKTEPSDVLTPLSYLSPIKSQTHPLHSPSKFCKIASPQSRTISKENATPSATEISVNPLSTNSDIKSPCGTVPKQNFQSLKRKLFGEINEIQKVTLLKLNMSTSVLQELLGWIYTGESSRLLELSRPLLVAAVRHDVEDLARAAQFHLASILSTENASELLLLSHKYGAKLLEEEAMRFSLSHASEITTTASWEALSLRYPEILLRFTRRLAASKV